MLDHCTVNSSIMTHDYSLNDTREVYAELRSRKMGQFVWWLRGNGVTPIYEAKEFPSTYIFRRISLYACAVKISMWCTNTYTQAPYVPNYSRVNAYSRKVWSKSYRDLNSKERGTDWTWQKNVSFMWREISTNILGYKRLVWINMPNLNNKRET